MDDGGVLSQIWLTGAAAGPMRRGTPARRLAGRGLEGGRHAGGGGPWGE